MKLKIIFIAVFMRSSEPMRAWLQVLQMVLCPSLRNGTLKIFVRKKNFLNWKIEPKISISYERRRFCLNFPLEFFLEIYMEYEYREDSEAECFVLLLKSPFSLVLLPLEESSKFSGVFKIFISRFSVLVLFSLSSSRSFLLNSSLLSL